MKITASAVDLDQLADEFVAQDPTSARADAKANGVLDTAEALRIMAAEQGGLWAPLGSDDGEQALVDAIRALR